MRESGRRLMAVGAFLGAFGVLAGAFGAHGLRSRLDARMLEVFEVGVRYHLIHAVAIVLAALVAERVGGALVAGWLFVVGVVLFSGSLYVLAVTGVRWFGAITPFGGVVLVAGWVWLGIAAMRARE